MLVERVPLVVKDPVQRCQVGRIRAQPGVDVLGLDVDDRPVVAGGGHLGLPRRSLYTAMQRTLRCRWIPSIAIGPDRNRTGDLARCTGAMRSTAELQAASL